MNMGQYLPRVFELAEQAQAQDEIPIGALLVKDRKIIAEAFNKTEVLSRFTAHAEMLCIEEATKRLGTKYLNGCSLYVSLEPCAMCRYAARLSRIDSIYYLLNSEMFGSTGQGYPKIHIEKIDDPLSDKLLKMMQGFFQKKRV